jgi:hypothetical protein
LQPDRGLLHHSSQLASSDDRQLAHIATAVRPLRCSCGPSRPRS